MVAEVGEHDDPDQQQTEGVHHQQGGINEETDAGLPPGGHGRNPLNRRLVEDVRHPGVNSNYACCKYELCMSLITNYACYKFELCIL